MDDMKPIRTRGGRTLVAVGDVSLVTIDHVEGISRHFDAEPRLASVSLVSSPTSSGEFLRATAPAGAVCIAALDFADLVGPPPILDPGSDDFLAWARAASDHGLWHDWLLSAQPNVGRAPGVGSMSDADHVESGDPSGSHYAALVDSVPASATLTVTIDATWLGPHETGAQVLTTAAVAALLRQPSIREVTLTGITELPAYAQHLVDLPGVRISPAVPERADIVWYPNQIDRRSNIGAARQLGHRVVTTYLDLIAYDIPRYHGSESDWLDYRALQRNIALSVDGITTISKDVAQRLRAEVPRLDPGRVLPIPLGLDHITRLEPHIGEEIRDLVENLGGRPFLLVLGNDFVHKNRDFAIRVWEQVLASGITCDLVLAGLHVRSSSSRDRERALLGVHTNLRGRAHSVGHVGGESRSWLLAHAAAVVYPSSAEGFGFVPYEAAALGTPTTFTAFGPLAEISGVSTVPAGWSIDAYAADITRLLQEPSFAEQRLADLTAAVTRHTWDRFATELVRFFARIRSMPTVSPVIVSGIPPVNGSPERGLVDRTSRALRATARRVIRRGR